MPFSIKTNQVSLKNISDSRAITKKREREEGRQGVQDGAETVFTHMLPVGMSNERATF